MTSYDWPVEKLNKKLFAIVGLKEVFFAFFDDSLAIYDL